MLLAASAAPLILALRGSGPALDIADRQRVARGFRPPSRACRRRADFLPATHRHPVGHRRQVHGSLGCRASGCGPPSPWSTTTTGAPDITLVAQRCTSTP
eukprot:8634953-Pyramimonas_sp.AAC.1